VLFPFFCSFPDNKKNTINGSPFNGVCCCLLMFQGKAESSIEKDANLKNASFSIFIFIFYKSTVCLLSAKP